MMCRLEKSMHKLYINNKHICRGSWVFTISTWVSCLYQGIRKFCRFGKQYACFVATCNFIQIHYLSSVVGLWWFYQLLDGHSAYIWRVSWGGEAFWRPDSEFRVNIWWTPEVREGKLFQEFLSFEIVCWKIYMNLPMEWGSSHSGTAGRISSSCCRRGPASWWTS